jgi:hypothetical protein
MWQRRAKVIARKFAGPWRVGIGPARLICLAVIALVSQAVGVHAESLFVKVSGTDAGGCAGLLKPIVKILGISQEPIREGDRWQFCVGEQQMTFSCSADDQMRVDTRELECKPLPRNKVSGIEQLADVMDGMFSLAKRANGRTEIRGTSFDYHRCVEIQKTLVEFWRDLSLTSDVRHEVDAKNEQIFAIDECGQRVTASCSATENALIIQGQKSDSADCDRLDNDLKSLLDSLD